MVRRQVFSEHEQRDFDGFRKGMSNGPLNRLTPAGVRALVPRQGDQRGGVGSVSFPHVPEHVPARTPRMRVLVAATMIATTAMGGCSLPGTAGHKYYDVAIDFTYQGKSYHEIWVHDCVINRSYKELGSGPTYTTYSAETGFAKRLPDGSGVFFKMRKEFCDDSEAGDIMLRSALSRSDTSRHAIDNTDLSGDQAKISAAAAVRAPDFVFPNVYWLDNAEHPTRIEACIYAECAESPTARVRVLAISGGESASKTASRPEREVPALAHMTAGTTRFVGYACWAVPVDGLGTTNWITPELTWHVAADTPDRRSVPASGRAEAVSYHLRERHLPLLNAWIWQPWQTATQHVDDLELADPDIAQQIDKPRNSWSSDCARRGDVVHFSDSPHDPDTPFDMTPMDRAERSPTTLVLGDGEILNAGLKQTVGSFISNVPEDPFAFSAAADGPNRTIYISEAFILTTKTMF